MIENSETEMPPNWAVRKNDLVGFDIIDETGNIVFQYPKISRGVYLLAWVYWRRRQDMRETI